MLAQSSWARAGKMQLSLPPTPGPRSLSQWQEGASIWPPSPPLSALLLTVLEPLLLPFPQKLFPVGPEDSFLDRKGAELAPLCRWGARSEGWQAWGVSLTPHLAPIPHDNSG